MQTKFPWGAFNLGVLVGAGAVIVIGALLGLLVYKSLTTYTGENADKDPITRFINQKTEEFAEGRSTTAFGEVQTIGNNAITIETTGARGVKTLSLRYDSNTTFMQFAQDTNLTEIPLTPNDIKAGDRVTVIADEEISGTENQYIVKVIKF